MSYFNKNESFDLRLHQSQIDLIVNALKNAYVLERDESKKDEMNVLIDVLEYDLQPDLINSLID